MTSISTSSGETLDFRRRQLKKDDALRRRIELELSRKRLSASRISRKAKAVPGTVMFLKPLDPILCKRTTTAYEAARLMAAKRENCVLVVSNEGLLEGIITAKDLAFRIVGASLSPNTVLIELIMTVDPICSHVNSPSSEALNLMVEKSIRHLPIVDDDENVVGVLDITKAYAQQMEKLERLHDSSHKLYEALDSVHSEIDLSDQPLQVFEYFHDLKLKVDGPTIESVLDTTTRPVIAGNRTTVYEATLLMKQHKTTAVLIKDHNESVNGIFTTKDVVLRVISAGLDPKNCSLVRVMTPRPDVALVDTTIQNALRLMYSGNYLNLPVAENGEIIAIVDVLKLTYSTLNQIKRVSHSSSGIITGSPQYSEHTHETNDPAWNQFWTTLDKSDTGSCHSDSRHSSNHNLLQSVLFPRDSMSVLNDEHIYSSTPTSIYQGDFIFKFKSPIEPERVHRITFKDDGLLDDLRKSILKKLDENEIALLMDPDQPLNDSNCFVMSYHDDDGDLVSLTTDEDLAHCFSIKRAKNSCKTELVLHQSPKKRILVTNEVNSVDCPAESTIAEIVTGVTNSVSLSSAIGLFSVLAIVLFVRGRH